MSTSPKDKTYTVPGVSSAGATTVYYDTDPTTGCGVTRITRFPGSPVPALINSANDPTPSTENSYYHPILGEWRPFPTVVVSTDTMHRRHRGLRHVGRLMVRARELGAPRVVRKEDISLPVPGSKRSVFEPIAEALQALL